MVLLHPVLNSISNPVLNWISNPVLNWIKKRITARITLLDYGPDYPTRFRFRVQWITAPVYLDSSTRLSINRRLFLIINA